MAITDSIKAILTVKIKPRHDSYSDQFSRIFLVKVMMIGALLVGLNWYNDKITCVIPGTHNIDSGFVSSACWINGLYVYEELRYHSNTIGYYGIPLDIKYDGKDADGDICVVNDEKDSTCQEMKKTFFLQYQYMTFVLALLAVLYYAPYGFFRFINQDMVSLKGSVAEGKAAPIVDNYFNSSVNRHGKLRLRVLGNIIIKICYILVNVGAFLLTNSTLNGEFTGYGRHWVSWSKLDNSMAYDYMGLREYPKPGNVLLPSFALCEVQDASLDIKTSITNKHKFVCELSQHILYQYVFIVLWFAMIFGIIVAVIGLLLQIADHLMTVVCFLRGGSSARTMYQSLTLRECEYLEFIRRKNLPLYGEIIELLKKSRRNGLHRNGSGDDLELLDVKGTLA